MKAERHILLLCGVFAKENEVEVIAQAKKSVEFSANQMQLKLIRGLKEAANTQVISAPFIGHYPNQSRSLYFFGFAVPQHLCKYVLFNNCIQRSRSVFSGSSLRKKTEPENKNLPYCSRSSAIYESRSQKRFSL